MVTEIRGRVRGLRDSRKLPFSLSIPDPFALDFDGSTEALVNSTDNTIGIANQWSVAVWLKPSVVAANWHLFVVDPSIGQNNDIVIFHVNTGFQFRASIHTSAGTLFKAYQWSNAFLSVGTWAHIVLTWDGTDLKLYQNATETAPDNTVADSAGTMTDTGRQTLIGTSTTAGANFFPGRLHSTAVFDIALDQAAITEIYDGKGAFDLRVDQNNYNQSENLQHYWRHGFNSSNIGEDLGNASTLIDVGDNALNITAADIVEDAPE